jgi:hypothetical protein
MIINENKKKKVEGRNTLTAINVLISIPLVATLTLLSTVQSLEAAGKKRVDRTGLDVLCAGKG